MDGVDEEKFEPSMTESTNRYNQQNKEKTVIIKYQRIN